MKALIRKIFEKTSIHGFAYIVRKDLHWSERILWGILILIATYFSVDVCWRQWERYKENPTVFGVERIMGTREFPYVGVTMCSNYFDEKQAEIIIQEKWNVSPEDDDVKYNYYLQFLQTLTNLEYKNLETLEAYEFDEALDDIDILKTIWDVNSSLYANNTAKNKLLGGEIFYSESVVWMPNGKPPPTLFRTVITEIGMCFTTSFLHEYQSPFDLDREPRKDNRRPHMCTPFDSCNLKVVPNSEIGEKVVAFIHSNHDIVYKDTRDAIRRVIKPNEISNVDIELQLISSESKVKNVPVQYRKCRFPDENNLKYFKTYRPILCRNECRINAALKLCQCKPFFYVVGPKGPICTIKGLLCLAKANWKNTKCDECLDMCSVQKYVALQAEAHVFNTIKLERAIMINFHLPKLGMRRRVVFSIDQMVVAFGGAASLFLGCSFLSFAQILYFIIEYFEEKIKNMYNRYYKK